MDISVISVTFCNSGPSCQMFKNHFWEKRKKLWWMFLEIEQTGNLVLVCNIGLEQRGMNYIAGHRKGKWIQFCKVSKVSTHAGSIIKFCTIDGKLLGLSSPFFREHVKTLRDFWDQTATYVYFDWITKAPGFFWRETLATLGWFNLPIHSLQTPNLFMGNILESKVNAIFFSQTSMIQRHNWMFKGVSGY